MIQIPSWELIKKYDRPGPRYTSYPTAPEWTDAFGPRRVRGAPRARRRGQGGPLSIYVHLPFCREMCRFCGCNVIATHDRTRAESYLDAPREGGRARREAAAPTGAPSPSSTGAAARPPSSTRSSSSAATRSSRATSTSRRTARRRSRSTRRSRRARRSRRSRSSASTGSRWACRTSTRSVQETVGRIQGVKETAELVQAARDNGFHGREPRPHLRAALPVAATPGRRRSTSSCRSTRTAWRCSASRTCPWSKPHQRLLPQEALPKPEQRVELFLQAVEAFTAGGYRLIGLDHFALESDELARAQDAAATCTGTSRGTRSAPRPTPSRSG